MAVGRAAIDPKLTVATGRHRPEAATRIQHEHIKFNSSLLIEDLTKQANSPIDTVLGHPRNQCLCFDLCAKRSHR